MSRVRQRVLLGKHLPATVVALVGDVAFAQFGLQLPQVQPGFIILAGESKCWDVMSSSKTLIGSQERVRAAHRENSVTAARPGLFGKTSKAFLAWANSELLCHQ